jgi:hypothetical protein
MVSSFLALDVTQIMSQFQIRRHGSPKVRYAMAELFFDGMKVFSLENHAARKTLHHFSETIPFTYAK